CQHNYATPFTF
nr:immunoglobulin light chain junction region [Macaca mulatta]MOW73641.1 immunoglobulin light chain junction region [Macaca mulatta]MOW74866.1 immunoglobulin light chain junction region [Macaca mulatta]